MTQSIEELATGMRKIHGGGRVNFRGLPDTEQITTSLEDCELIMRAIYAPGSTAKA